LQPGGGSRFRLPGLTVAACNGPREKGVWPRLFSYRKLALTAVDAPL